jgi:ribosomal protein S18 acetylase RimI-like enzyme
MTASSPPIRPARKSDAAALAVLVDIAGEGMPSHMWSTMKEPGQSLLEFGRSRAARDTGAFSWRNATVAEIDTEVAGCLIDYRLDDPYESGDLIQIPDVVRPLIQLEAKAPGSWYVNVLATFPEFRGQGLGSRFLHFAEERARAAGAGEASIIVAGDNSGAMRLYTRVGYGERARAPLVTFSGAAHGGDWVLLTKKVAG